MKRAFLIVGPEGSGNHLLCRLFAECGVLGKCAAKEKDGGPVVQNLLTYFWAEPKVDNPYEIWGEAIDGDVFLGTSIPCEYHPLEDEKYYKVIADFRNIRNRLVKEGFKVVWVIPVRNHYCTAKSQERRNFEMLNGKNRFEWIQHLYRMTLLQAYTFKDGTWIFPISDLWNNYEVVKKELKDNFGLKLNDKFRKAIYNADEKYVRALQERKEN